MDDEDALVSYALLRSMFGITYSRTHIRRKELAGTFPRRLKTSTARGARFFYRLKEVRNWLRTLEP